MTRLRMAITAYALAAELWRASPTEESNRRRLRALAEVAEARAGL